MEDADRLVPEFRVAIMLANGWNMRRLIRKKIEIQFDADFPDSLFSVFQIHWAEIRTLLIGKYERDPKDEDMLACNGSMPM